MTFRCWGYFSAPRGQGTMGTAIQHQRNQTSLYTLTTAPFLLPFRAGAAYRIQTCDAESPHEPCYATNPESFHLTNAANLGWAGSQGLSSPIRLPCPAVPNRHPPHCRLSGCHQKHMESNHALSVAYPPALPLVYCLCPSLHLHGLDTVTPS